MDTQPDQVQPPQESPEPAADSPWNYAPEADTPAGASAAPQFAPQAAPVEWTASEFMHHEKPASWFLGLAGAAIVVVVLVYLVTRDLITAGVVLITAVLFGIMAVRRPNTLHYRIDETGIKIGNRLFEYVRFKSFSIVDEGAIGCIQLVPLGRFAPPISIYFPPDQGDAVVNTLGSYLPHEDRKRDTVDRFMNKIRF